MVDRTEVRAAVAADKEEAHATGIREERRKSNRDRFIAAVLFLLTVLVGFNLYRNLAQDVRAEIQEERAADITKAKKKDQADAAARDEATAAKLQSLIDASGGSVTKEALSAALDSLPDSGVIDKAALAKIIENLPPGPPGPAGPSGLNGADGTGIAGPSGEPYSGPPPKDGEDGEDAPPAKDGQDGEDGHTPVITFALAGTNLAVTIDGVQTDLGNIQGPQGRNVVALSCDPATGDLTATYFDPANGVTSVEPAGKCPSVTTVQTVTETTTATPTEPTPTDPPPTDPAAPTT